MPPYDDDRGRPCTYFREVRPIRAGEPLCGRAADGANAGAGTTGEKQRLAPGDGAWLEEIPQPEDFSVGTYRGADEEGES